MSKRLWLMIALQIVLLLTIVGKYQYVAYTGQLITLKTAPVDPVDPFYGDYVTLNYEIALVDGNRVPHDVKLVDYGKRVYVVLQKKANPWYEAVGVYREKPMANAGQVVLAGTLQYVDEYAGKQIHIRYGVERYYVTENTGRDIENRRDELSMVEIRVAGSGDAVIQRLVFK
ncbi:MAG: GDYXXLXY domain-containing protein [Clostridia bacterium]